MRVIVTLSGGKSSAWCAQWALRNYPKESVVLYFNDTGWEHPDLYRFLRDLESFFSKVIYEDSDGRTPEDLFYARKALANNRMPFCSATLKADRLQKFIRDGDVIVFGISLGEGQRALRIEQRYYSIAKSKGMHISVRFPILENTVSSEIVDSWLKETGIQEPYLYTLGFSHNNCSGGCVRAGKKQWKRLYDTLPEVYAERERVEREVREYIGKDVSFFRDETLEEFRHRIEAGKLSKHYLDNSNVEDQGECVGVCSFTF